MQQTLDQLMNDRLCFDNPSPREEEDLEEAEDYEEYDNLYEYRALEG